MLKRATQHRVAVVQHPPVTLHREKTLQRGADLIEEAAAGGAALVSLPETWLPGYPEWLWRLRPGADPEATPAIPARTVGTPSAPARGRPGPIGARGKGPQEAVAGGCPERG